MSLLKLQAGIVYGPVNSRRLGRSLGINLLPTRYKLCSFNCVYCHYGWTQVLTTRVSEHELPTVEEVKAALLETLRSRADFDYITFSGNGEPTLHPRFKEIIEVTRGLRDRYAPHARLAILSNSTALNRPEVRKALESLELRIMKLDAGDPITFTRINRPCPVLNYESVLDGLQALKGIVIQTVFVDGAVSNVAPEALDHWIERLKAISPLKVQIYSIDRPAAHQGLKKVEIADLKKIVHQAESAIHIPVEVYSIRG